MLSATGGAIRLEGPMWPTVMAPRVYLGLARTKEEAR
jgi:hypothetical protein